MQGIVQHEAGEEQWKRLLLMQNSIAHIVQIPLSNKIFKTLVLQGLADRNTARKCQAEK